MRDGIHPRNCFIPQRWIKSVRNSLKCCKKKSSVSQLQFWNLKWPLTLFAVPYGMQQFMNCSNHEIVYRVGRSAHKRAMYLLWSVSYTSLFQVPSFNEVATKGLFTSWTTKLSMSNGISQWSRFIVTLSWKMQFVKPLDPSLGVNWMWTHRSDHAPKSGCVKKNYDMPNKAAMDFSKFHLLPFFFPSSHLNNN